jgi:hypothetical protein
MVVTLAWVVVAAFFGAAGVGTGSGARHARRADAAIGEGCERPVRRARRAPTAAPIGVVLVAIGTAVGPRTRPAPNPSRLTWLDELLGCDARGSWFGGARKRCLGWWILR